ALTMTCFFQAEDGIRGGHVQTCALPISERDDARVAARLRERHRRERELEGARHRHDRDGILRDARAAELLERRLEQPRGDLAVEDRKSGVQGTCGAVGAPASSTKEPT